MVNLSNKNILLYDLSGTFTFAAERMARDFGKVCYFSQWQGGFSQSKDFLPGHGLPDVERIDDPFRKIDDFDLWWFTDVGMGGLQEFLRREGIPVFGCGDGQALEINRVKLKEELIAADLAIAKSRVITGIDRLRAILMKETDLFIKMSFFRGDGETFRHDKWFSTATWLNNLAVQLGPYGEIAEFLVEEPIEGDAVEIGYDTFAVNGQLPENMLFGYEVKDAGFLGTTDPLPQRLRDNANKFQKVLEKYNYTGILSTELRVTKDEEYLIDFTARCPSPPSEVECAITDNLAEIVYEGAKGNLVEPEFNARYGAMLVMKSDWIVDHALALQRGRSDRVFLHGHFKLGNKDYAIVPEGFPEFAGAVGIGDTVEEAIEEALDAAESVDGYQVRYDGDAFEEAIKTIRAGQKLGLDWHAVAPARAA